MEQVLHPEKYLEQRDEPTVLIVSEATGESVESEGRLGEFLIRVLFQSVLPRLEAEGAAAGWGGDQYALWADEQTYRLVWRTTWDSVQEAQEFHRALSQFASLRYGSGGPPSGESVTFESDRGERSHIRYNGSDVTLEREGLRLTE
jgi:hypothetical protein